MYQELFFRNEGAVRPEEQETLKTSRVAVVGLGGSGGFALENLLRMGVENLTVFDGDRFELSNMNRQLLCSIPALDKPKAQVAKARAREINPSARVEEHTHFTASSQTELANVQVVMDCTDRVETHLAINRACNAHGIAHVFAACNDSRGMVSVLENYDLAKMFQLPVEEERLKAYHRCTSILAPAATLAGGLATAQATAYLLGKPYVRAPDAMMFDLFGERVFWRERLE